MSSPLRIQPAPDDSLEFAHKLVLDFDVLSDLDQSVVLAWRLQFPLPVTMRDAYTSLGMGLDDHNADGSWILPVLATFVLNTTGKVVARHVDPNYRERMPASEILAALEQLQP
jgi:peroxiredoxin